MKRAMRRFPAFENAVVSPIRGFWRSNDATFLDESAKFLRALDEQVDTHVASPIHDVVIAGWLSTHAGYTISPRVLRRINPGFRISLKREDRKDVVTGAEGDEDVRLGFRIEAYSSHDKNPFIFAVVAPDSRIFALPASNPDVAERLPAGYPDLKIKIHTADETSTPPFGYVDYLMQSPRGLTKKSSTWLAAIVHRSPKEMLEFIDSEQGNFLARDALEVLSIYPSDAAWADRFNLVALGSEGTFVSDLIPLVVERPNRDPARPTGLTVPGRVVRGKTVDFVQGTRPMPAPSSTWLRLRDAIVQDGGTVIVDGHLISYEASADPSLDFVAGQWESIFGSRAHPDTALVRMQPVAETTVAEGILLSGRNDSNWYHWLIEYLPRLMQLESTLGPDVPVIVTSRTPATGMDALRAITDRPVVVLDPALAYSVGILHVVAPPVQILDTTRVPWEEGLSLNPVPVLAMRDRLVHAEERPAPTRRVFLRRTSGHRGLLNEADLATIAGRHGLEILDPGTMSWSQQVALFSSATLLVGASGAVMANYLLMSPGSRVLALTSDALNDFVLPAALANLVGVRFSYLTGPGSVKLAKSDNRNNWLHSDFSISTKEFESALRRTIQSLPAGPEPEPEPSMPGSDPVGLGQTPNTPALAS
jgi:capsular polysaccharide biosynthesis protein